MDRIDRDADGARRALDGALEPLDAGSGGMAGRASAHVPKDVAYAQRLSLKGARDCQDPGRGSRPIHLESIGDLDLFASTKTAPITQKKRFTASVQANSNGGDPGNPIPSARPQGGAKAARKIRVIVDKWQNLI